MVALPPLTLTAGQHVYGDVEVTIVNGVASWTSGMAIDADGSPRAYAPRLSGLAALDNLKNAGSTGHWFGLVVDRHGEPVIQGSDDQAPGFYLSPSALVDHAHPVTSGHRYVDASKIPYASIPRGLLGVIHLGDVGRVTYRGHWCDVIVADVGGNHAIGEASPACARQLGIDPCPKNGGVAHGVSYRIWCGSSQGWPRSLDSISRQVAELAMVPVG